MFSDEYAEWFLTDDEDLEYLPGEDEGDYYLSAGWTPNPILVGGIILAIIFLVWSFLTRLTPVVFHDEFMRFRDKEVALSRQSQKQSSIGTPATSSEENQAVWNGDCEVSQLYPAKITRWCGLITQYSNKHKLDPDLVAALVWLESGGNELAYSRSGAVGLMQVMPRDGLAASFMCANGPCFKDRPSTDELRNPENNIAFGTKYLAGLIRRNGNLRDALKSYGPMDAGYTYSDKVLSIFNRYRSE